MAMDDKALMREFYKSGASNFPAFKRAYQNQSVKGGKAADTAVAAAPTKQLNATAPSISPPPAAANKAASQDAPPAPAGKTAAGSPIAVAQQQRKERELKSEEPRKEEVRKEEPRPAPVADRNNTKKVEEIKEPDFNMPDGSASAEYIAFLRQQQELQKCHQKLEECVGQYERDRQNCQANVAKTRGQAAEVLQSLEAGTNWNLTSRYTVQTLIKDAKLQLQQRELYHHDDKPQYLDIVQQEGNLDKLKKDHTKRDAYAHFSDLFNNAARRLERVLREVKNCQLDATNIARLPDTLFIQLDHVLSSPTIEEILQDTEDHMEDLLFKLEHTKEELKQALDDGEMPKAEEFSYDSVKFYEGILELILDKLATTERQKKENQLFDKVREQYQKKAQDEVSQLKKEKDQLKQRCEADLQKIFALKEKVDAVESQTVSKLQADLKASDKMLSENSFQIESLWAKINLMEQELEQLENDRYQEVKRRVATKEKDEHRRMEYQTFCSVVEKHSGLLDLTIRNCDTAIHVISLLGELVNTGFNTLGNFLNGQDLKYGDGLLSTHKQHLEHFRGLYLALGELIHKKEKKIEEIDRAIQEAHIKQQLAIDTLNPNAKLYSDAKKGLLLDRDRVEQELKELKGKAQVALANFRVSEGALHEAGVPFVHPVVQQQEQELEHKAKMVEYKAMAIGHVDALPIQQELQAIKRQLHETKQVVDSVNNSTYSSMNSTLPKLNPPPSLR